MDNENAVTIATHNGSQVAREHNRRNPKVILKEDHIDPEGHFEIWLDEDPKAAYSRLFGKAVEEYNAKQTKEERKIKDYYSQVCKDEKKHPVYEMIVGIYGKTADGSPVCSKQEGKRILRAFVEDWQKRNPSLELIGAYYHADEEGAPHVHLDYIPVAKGYTRGMSVQNGIARALQQQGFKAQGQLTEQMQWQARENQLLGSLCSSRGLTVLHPGSKEHMDTEKFKLQKQIEDLQQKTAALSQEIKNKEHELEVAQDNLETLKARKSLSQAVLEVAELPDRKIEVEHLPGKKKTLTKPEQPPKVVMLESDYQELRNRALASSLLRQAHDKLQRLGNELVAKVNRSRRIAELQERVAAAEAAARSAEIDLTYARGEVREVQEQAMLQQDWMQQQTDRHGKSLWEYFLDFITRQRERDELEISGRE